MKPVKRNAGRPPRSKAPAPTHTPTDARFSVYAARKDDKSHTIGLLRVWENRPGVFSARLAKGVTVLVDGAELDVGEFFLNMKDWGQKSSEHDDDEPPF